MPENPPEPAGEFLLYQTEDGHSRVECRLDNEMLWLRHWSAKDRNRRLFFCQLEAAETMIYLNEILASGRRGSDPSRDECPRWQSQHEL